MGSDKERKVTCKEARAALRVMDLNKKFGDMSKEEMEFAKHYFNCKTCRDLGLEEKIGKMSCQDALLELAKYPEYLWHFPHPDHNHTLNCLRATEHVGGKYEWQNNQSGHVVTITQPVALNPLV